LIATPPELDPLDGDELRKLRMTNSPQKEIQECLELVYMLMNLDRIVDDIQCLPTRDSRLYIHWSAVQDMLGNLDTFKDSMHNYDVQALAHAPVVAKYFSNCYFDKGGLTHARIMRTKKVSVSCSILLQWCSRTVARASAAMQVPTVDAQLAELKAQPQHCRIESKMGWREFPDEIDEKLREAEAESGMTTFKMQGIWYEANIAQRVVKNLGNNQLLPIRPPGNVIDKRTLQVSWHTSLGVVTVRDTEMEVNGSVVSSPLEVLEDGSICWVFEGKWHADGGSPMTVRWVGDSDDMMWIAAVGWGED